MTKQNNDWIKWAGGECPVEGSVLVQVELRNGYRNDVTPADCFDWATIDDAVLSLSDIIAYRVVSA